ncbi:MAG: PEP-CTERM sorting domain-containing protein [Planctomycetales bacterium]|nr:PEP-CTERM sorting domain-containing protein [Planctomycetales bacterium]
MNHLKLIFIAIGNALLVVCITYSSALAETDRFVEVFDGRGPFPANHPEAPIGFNNPGWILRDDTDVSFEEGGLEFNKVPRVVRDNIESLRRGVVGRGSFRHFLEIRDLSIHTSEEGARGVSQVSVYHFVNSQTSEAVFLRAAVGSFGNFFLDLNVNGESFTVVDDPALNLGTDVSFAIEFNEMSRQVIFEYDDDVLDESSEPLSWVFAYDGTVGTHQSTTLEFLLDAEGVVPYWSLTNLDRDPNLADFDSDGVLTVADIEQLVTGITNADFDSRFDLDFNNRLNDSDLEEFVREYAGTYYGDANLDGRFDSQDFVQAFQFAEYEDRVPGNSTWRSGDWNLDSEFDTRDLVLAFQDGGYEKGPRVGAAVPEPNTVFGVLLGVCALAIWRNR